MIKELESISIKLNNCIIIENLNLDKITNLKNSNINTERTNKRNNEKQDYVINQFKLYNNFKYKIGDTNIKLNNIEYINSGKQGNVYKIYDNNKQYVLGLKIFKESQDIELEILRLLTEKKNNCQILKSKIIKFYINDIQNKCIIFNIFNNDLTKLNFNNIKIKNKLNLLKQVSDDINCLAENEFYYTDIKLENILYKCLDNNKILIRLGDLGSIALKDNDGFYNPIISIRLHLQFVNNYNNIIKKLKNNKKTDKYIEFIKMITFIVIGLFEICIVIFESNISNIKDKIIKQIKDILDNTDFVNLNQKIITLLINQPYNTIYNFFVRPLNNKQILFI